MIRPREYSPGPGNMTARAFLPRRESAGQWERLDYRHPTAELYDPAASVFTAAGPANNYGSGSTALLQDGRVLIPGTDGVSLYDVSRDSLKLVAKLPGDYAFQTTTVLVNGKVLIAGGEGDDYDGTLNQASLYDSRRGTLEGTGTHAVLP